MKEFILVILASFKIFFSQEKIRDIEGIEQNTSHGTILSYMISNESSEIVKTAKDDYKTTKTVEVPMLNKVYSERIVAMELNEMAKIYEARFKQAIPICKQCSNLELLLILEKAIQTNIAYPKNIINKPEKVKIDKEKEEYEKKFKSPIPWWWVCSDEERLDRLKKALETNTPYPYYFLDDREMAYTLGKVMAEYEIQFKKQPPEWHCSDEERLWRLQRILGIASPYITEKEKIKFEFELKAEYKKRFGIPITDFELSIVTVYFKIGGFGRKPSPRILVIRTTTGAIAKYLPSGVYEGSVEQLEIKLDMEEWLDFINMLYKCQVDKWEKNYRGSAFDGTQWNIKMFFLNKEKLEFSGSNAYPLSWKKFRKIMLDMEAKIKKL